MLEVFQSLAYPVAVSVILFAAMGFFAKRMLEDMRKRDEENIKLRDQYVAFLQMSNVELTGALKENATASKENAEALKQNAMALNRFSASLEKFESILNKLTKE